MKTYKELYQRKKLNAWIDLSTYCNAACPQCHRTNPRTLKKVDWLPLVQWSLKEFKTAFPVKTLESINNFNFCGTWGDPCMNKDILNICEYIINNSDSYIIINTNGSMRDNFWWTHLGYIIQDRGQVVFDIDGTTQEMHSHYRQKTNLKLILDNMKGYNTYSDASVFTVVYKHNEDYLKEIHDMVSDIIGKHHHCFVPSDRAHHIEKFKFYKDGEEQFLEHSPKYGKSAQRSSFELDGI